MTTLTVTKLQKGSLIADEAHAVMLPDSDTDAVVTPGESHMSYIKVTVTAGDCLVYLIVLRSS